MRIHSLPVATLLLLLCAATRLYAQPQISYIIPDIGAPGMNTYVEIIAPESSSSPFGADNFYLNNPGDVFRVQGIGARANDIVVGPVVVSWSGRLISTQIFVKPGVGTGTIPLQVTTGLGTATVDFEIVNPGIINNPAPGPLGPRSRRGAMIVNSVTLNSGTYTIDTFDPDNATSGNQGYLPFILISKGPVSIGSGVTIDVSANGRDGGPGGGGGGGQVCDANPLGSDSPGTDGGNGYTGGGAGGKNGEGSPFQNKGQGTSASGNALSGAEGGQGDINCSDPEGSSGGTGHPFGRGGEGFCGGSPSGQFGGGSTGQDMTAGGGAGYGADGASGTSNAQNNGRSHGNVQLVPLAGGSGGGSGNPRAILGGCAGYGGGGGGAIAVYSMEEMRLNGKLDANGASGGSPSSGQRGGGGGSGGGIMIGAKMGLQGGGVHTVNGGPGSSGGGNGSVGRVRFDGFPTSAPAFGANTPYIGLSTDTTSFATSSSFTLTGTYGGSAELQVYMRGDNTGWQRLAAPSVSGRNWSLDVSTPGGGNFYFVAFQKVAGANSAQRSAVPGFVTSQVAANLVNVIAGPRIDTVGDIGGSLGNAPDCPDLASEPREIFRFKSTGDEDLIVRIELIGADAQYFTVLPAGIDAPGGLSYEPNLTKENVISVIGNPPPGMTAGFRIRIITNDPRKGYDTIEVSDLITMARLNIQTEIRYQAERADTVDFGLVCISTAKDDSISVWFKGDIPAYVISSVTPRSTPPFSVTTPGSGAFPVIFSQQNAGEEYSDSLFVRLRFRPTAVGSFFDSISVNDNICGSRIVYLRGEGIENKVSILPANAINFNATGIGKSKEDTVCIVNTGQSPITIESYELDPPLTQYEIIDPPNIVGTVLQPGEKLKLTIRFTPDAVGSYISRLLITPEGPCNNISPIILNGLGVEKCLDADLTEILFVADSCSSNPTPLDTLLTLKNCGGIEVDVTEAISVNNKVTITFPSGLPATVRANNNTVRPTITWDPVATGSGTDTVLIVWQDKEDGIADTIRIPVTMQFDRAVVELQTVAGDTVPSLLDIGGVYQCGPASDTLVLVNTGTVEGEITGEFTNGGLFDVDVTLPFKLAVGESKKIVVTIDPANAPDVGTTYQDELVLRNGKCDQEWRIALLSTRYDLTFDVNGINFGGTNLNLPRTRTVQFTNTTNAPPTEELVISRVYVDPPGASPPFEVVDPTLFPTVVMADSGRFSFDVSFTPAEEKLYNGRLCFEITAPCDTVICVDLTGEGIKSNIYVPKGNLDFGGVYYCAEDTLDLTIYSVGPERLIVSDIQIAGGDVTAFEILGISETLPYDMDPGFPTIQDSIIVKIRFIPGNVPPDGVKNSTLEITSNDAAQGLLVIPLTGERTSPTVVGPALVDYGTVVVNASGVQSVTLTNTSQDEIIITNPRLGSPFSIVSTLPIVIPAGESVDVQVQFNPTDSRVYNDTLVGEFALPCDGIVRIPLTGEGLRGSTVISIPATIAGEPRQMVSVPIVLEKAESIAEVGATTFEAWIRFNATMLLPTELNFTGAAPKGAAATGEILENIIDGEDRVLKVRITNDPLPAAPATLGSIDALVLLGNSITTPVSFDSLRWVDGEVATTLTNGEFNLQGYCEVGSNRLVRIEGGFGIKAVTPNPFDEATEIRFETVENGPTSLEVYDIYGKRISTLVDAADLPVQAHITRWNADGTPAGVYYAVLTTPTQRSVQRIVLVK